MMRLSTIGKLSWSNILKRLTSLILRMFVAS